MIFNNRNLIKKIAVFLAIIMVVGIVASAIIPYL